MRRRLYEWTSSHAIGWRAVPPEALHVTLVFLGRTPAARVPDLLDATRHAVGGLSAPELVATGVRVVSRRLVAAELEDRGGRAALVAHTCARAFADLGLHEPEQRPFWAHVTLARARRGERGARAVRAPPPGSRFVADTVTLFESRPAPSGPRYIALGNAGLTVTGA